jgi:hypothetical protein
MDMDIMDMGMDVQSNLATSRSDEQAVLCRLH